MKALLLASLVLFAGCSKQSAPEPKQPASAPDQPTAGAAAPAQVPAAIASAVASPDRDDKDRALDDGRKPAEVLAFFKVAPGQKVGELFAGMGYTTEILARTIGENGKLYVQNTKEIMDKFARQPLAKHLAKPALKNTTLFETPAETPFPPEVKDLDEVICILNYHDYVWQKVDRAKMNKAIFAALKPGGYYVIADHSGRPGTGISESNTLHRIEEAFLRREVEQPGFRLVAEGTFLRNPKDPRDRETPEPAQPKDEFVLKYRKP